MHKQHYKVGRGGHDVGTEEEVLNMVKNDPNTSTRYVTREIGVSNWKVRIVLLKNKIQAFHLYCVQVLEETDLDPKV